MLLTNIDARYVGLVKLEDGLWYARRPMEQRDLSSIHIDPPPAWVMDKRAIVEGEHFALDRIGSELTPETAERFGVNAEKLSQINKEILASIEPKQSATNADVLVDDNTFLISNIEPDITFQGDKALLTVWVSDAVGEPNALETVAQYIDKVCDPNNHRETRLNIDIDLATIPDYFLEINCEGADVDEEGLYHMDEELRPQVDMVRAGLLAALAKLDNVRYHTYEE